MVSVGQVLAVALPSIGVTGARRDQRWIPAGVLPVVEAGGYLELTLFEFFVEVLDV